MNAQAEMGLGDLYVKNGNIRQASEAYKAALRLGPGDPAVGKRLPDPEGDRWISNA